ncbi:MAG: translation elongation factor Ts [Candidatus Omnitrophica bacterium]|nr:translation elongation factor Ts [Candidatus Omnitrophota bacterium]
MTISAEDIKELREMTSCGVMECKKALEESNGDKTKAVEVLKRRGLELAAKKGSRMASEGRIEAYIHAGSKIGVIVEVNCETDFVAKNEDFATFTKDLAMHIAALNPRYVQQEDIPQAELDEQKDPKAYVKEQVLMNQPFIKDPKLSIQEKLNNLIASIGENICIRRFIRYKVNEVE